MSESSFLHENDSDAASDVEFSPLSPGEIVLGTLIGLDANGNAQVNYPQNLSNASVTAISTQPLTPQQIGRQVALLFAGGDLQKPIIMGFIHSPLYDLLENFSFATEDQPDANEDQQVFDNPLPKSDSANLLQTETVRVDGKKVVIEGQEEVVLTCGESSITLTKAGKIIIRGKYLLSRSTGVNRILGGSVQVN